MTMPRKANRHHYTPEEKAHWGIEVLKGEQTLAQLSSESGVHVNQLRQWRDALVAHAGDVFASDKPAVRELQEAHEREKTELYAEIGQLTTQVNWLKKKSGALLPR
jgi:transposase